MAEHWVAHLLCLSRHRPAARPYQRGLSAARSAPVMHQASTTTRARRRLFTTWMHVRPQIPTAVDYLYMTGWELRRRCRRRTRRRRRLPLPSCQLLLLPLQGAQFHESAATFPVWNQATSESPRIQKSTVPIGRRQQEISVWVLPSNSGNTIRNDFTFRNTILDGLSVPEPLQTAFIRKKKHYKAGRDYMDFSDPYPVKVIDGKPFGVTYCGSPRIIGVNKQKWTVPMGMARACFGETMLLTFGGPGHEVIVDDRWYNIPFDGVPRRVTTSKGSLTICLVGPEPPVKVLGEVKTPAEIARMLTISGPAAGGSGLSAAAPPTRRTSDSPSHIASARQAHISHPHSASSRQSSRRRDRSIRSPCESASRLSNDGDRPNSRDPSRHLHGVAQHAIPVTAADRRSFCSYRASVARAVRASSRVPSDRVVFREPAVPPSRRWRFRFHRWRTNRVSYSAHRAH